MTHQLARYLLQVPSRSPIQLSIPPFLQPPPIAHKDMAEHIKATFKAKADKVRQGLDLTRL